MSETCGDVWSDDEMCTLRPGHPGLHVDERLAPPRTRDGGDGPCQDCGRTYPAWFAPHEVWNFVMGGPDAIDDPGGLLCPTCFLIRANVVTPIPAWHIGHPPAPTNPPAPEASAGVGEGVESWTGCGRMSEPQNAENARSVVVYVDPPDPTRSIHPCNLGRHRWAWLIDGRQACGYCGKARR